LNDVTRYVDTVRKVHLLPHYN